MSPRAANILAGCVIALGSLAMLGHITGIRALKGIGLASAAAPYPKVFCDAVVPGDPASEIETFASRFTISYAEADGERTALPVTPNLYARLGGPYNRRNVYGAILSYAPALPPAIWQAGFRYALVDPGTLRRELGLPDGAHDFEVLIEPQTRGRTETWTLR